jgi:hypothetical protein
MDVAPHHKVTIAGPDDYFCATTVAFMSNAQISGSYFSGRRDAEERELELPSGIVVGRRGAGCADERSLLCLIRHGASMTSPPHKVNNLGDGRKRSGECQPCEFKNGETVVLTETPVEKTSNKMKFVGRQLLLWLIIGGTVYRSQGTTLQRAVIDYRMKCREHRQLHVALSGVKSPGDLCILFPDDVDDFTIRPAIDVDVV